MNQLVEKKLTRKNLAGTQTTLVIWVCIAFIWHQVVVFIHLCHSHGCHGWWVQTESNWVWIESGGGNTVLLVAVGVVWNHATFCFGSKHNQMVHALPQGI